MLLYLLHVKEPSGHCAGTGFEELWTEVERLFGCNRGPVETRWHLGLQLLYRDFENSLNSGLVGEYY